MAISYPLEVADLWERLRFAGRPFFALDPMRSQSQDNAGNVYAAFRPQPKWRADVNIAGGWHDANVRVMTELAHLEMRNGTFLAYDTRRPYPANDPTGSIIGSTTVRVLGIAANAALLSLKNLPAGYRITRGDKLSILYDTTKIFLLEAAETITADGSGNTAEFEIHPFLPEAVAVNHVVTLRKAPGKFRIVAGSLRGAGELGNISEGASFSMVSVP